MFQTYVYTDGYYILIVSNTTRKKAVNAFMERLERLTKVPFTYEDVDADTKELVDGQVFELKFYT